MTQTYRNDDGNWQNPCLSVNNRAERRREKPNYSKTHIPRPLLLGLVVTLAIITIAFVFAITPTYAAETNDFLSEKYGEFPKLTWYSPKDITRIQEALEIEVDGVFGEETSRAVKDFQLEVGLPATGVVDNDTADYLGISTEAAHSCYQVDLEKLGEETDEDYIIYVNLYYHTLSVFHHLGERWLEIGTVPCAVGAEGRETPVGIFEIYDNGAEYFEHGGYLWCHPSFFNGEYGIHSVSFDPESRYWGTEALGESVSLGCIRVEDVVAQWIQFTCPLGTPVAIDDRV